MTLTLYRLTTDEPPLWGKNLEVLVLAPSEEEARACMTYGSDSVWASVESCARIFTCDVEVREHWYINAGGYVVG